MSFVPQPSVAIKIKDCSHSFCYENTEYLLSKVIPEYRSTPKQEQLSLVKLIDTASVVSNRCLLVFA